MPDLSHQVQELSGQINRVEAKLDRLLSHMGHGGDLLPPDVVPDSTLLAKGRKLVHMMTAARRAGDTARLRELRRIQPRDIEL